MEKLDFYSVFVDIINDSNDERNKIGCMTVNEIFNRLLPIAEESIRNMDVPAVNLEERLKKFITIIKIEKPGYVFKDLANILILGGEGQFGEAVRLDSEVLYKWFYEYGKKPMAKDVHTSKRNYWIGEAYKLMTRDSNDTGNYTTLDKIIQEKGAKYFKENFSTINALLKGKLNFGKEMPDVPVTWKRDPLYNQNQ